MSQAMFEVTAVATGEVRDADGNLLTTVHGKSETIQVPASELAKHTDEQLRAAGLDDTTIEQIRKEANR